MGQRLVLRSSAEPARRLLRLPSPGAVPVQLVTMPPRDRLRPTWRDASPARIDAALARSQQRPTGNWYVVAASRDLGSDSPLGRVVAGVDLVVWRTANGSVVAGPDTCPHLGASLCTGEVLHGRVVCRWHGLALGPEGFPGWTPYVAHDDGVLVWVRLDAVGGEEPSERPYLGARPPLAVAVDAVMATVGCCEPEDVVANRLDPWHGAWLHPYSFSHLDVVDSESNEDSLVVDVTFRLSRRWGMPVRAVFTTPDRRTIAMHISDGEGAGSVVETHATPLGTGADGRPRTAVVEVTLAYSARPGFAVASRLAGAARPLMRLAARRLWVDDLAYAERRYSVRTR